jgi:hypothetical protein
MNFSRFARHAAFQAAVLCAVLTDLNAGAFASQTAASNGNKNEHAAPTSTYTDAQIQERDRQLLENTVAIPNSKFRAFKPLPVDKGVLDKLKWGMSQEADLLRQSYGIPPRPIEAAALSNWLKAFDIPRYIPKSVETIRPLSAPSKQTPAVGCSTTDKAPWDGERVQGQFSPSSGNAGRPQSSNPSGTTNVVGVWGGAVSYTNPNVALAQSVLITSNTTNFNVPTVQLPAALSYGGNPAICGKIAELWALYWAGIGGSKLGVGTNLL